MIRQATIADVSAIVEMARLFYATTEYRKWADFNDETVKNLTETLVKDHVLLVADEDGELKGMVALFVAPFMFNADVTAAYEVAWWVNPDAQGIGVGKALLAAIEPACKARGCTAIQMVHLSTSPPQAAAIYEHMGYAHTESSFTRIVKWQQ